MPNLIDLDASENETITGDESASINLGIGLEKTGNREVCIDDFHIKSLIGTGTYSKVYLVE